MLFQYLTGTFLVLGWTSFTIGWRIWHWNWRSRITGIVYERRYGILPPGTLYGIIAIAVGICVWQKNYFPAHGSFFVAIIQFAGIFVFLCGLVFGFWARRTLGKYWSPHSALVQEGHEVIRWGPYAVVRHPIYLAEIVMSLGTCIWVGSWLLAILLGGGIALFDYYRAVVEEAVLRSRFGAAYGRYQNDVPMLLPYVSCFISRLLLLGDDGGSS